MKKNLTILFLLLFICGCRSFGPVEVYEPTENEVTEAQFDASMLRTRSGSVSNENPYSLENIQTAVNQVMTSPVIVDPSHYYVRFLPQDTVHVEWLEDINRNLELFTYPLDRILTDEEIDFYENDTIEGYIWLYTIVPLGFVFPEDFDYEILDMVYIQNNEGEGTRGPSDPMFTEDQWESIVTQAMINGGYEDDSPQTRGSAWYPSARITYRHPFTNEIMPLQRVQVRVSNFVNYGYAMTNANGETGSIKGWGGRFRNGVRYKIRFENKGTWKWKIKSGVWGVVEYKGPDIKRSWEHTFPQTGYWANIAAISRAFNEFYYKNNVLTKPEDLDMSVAAKDQSHPNKNGHFQSWKGNAPFSNPLTVWLKNHQSNTYITPWRVESTTFHELGHASHWQTVVDSPTSGRFTHYHNAQTAMKEGFARAVQFYFISRQYPNFINNVRPTYDSEYNSVGEAFMNQGFTISELQNAVRQSRDLDDWKYVINRTGRVDARLVDLFFEHRDQAWDRNFNDLIDGPETIGKNTIVTYTFPQSMIDNGVTIRDWSFSDSTHEIVEQSDDNTTISVRYLTTGRKTIMVNCTLPTGAFWQSSKSVNVVTAIGIIPTANPVLFAAPGGQATIDFATTAYLLSVEPPNVEWLSVQKGSDSKRVIITVQQNPGGQRSGSFDVRAGNDRLTVVVNQSAEAPYLIINPDELDFENGGGQQTTTIISNLQWKLVDMPIPEFMTISPSSGGPGATSVKVTLAENTSFSRRRGTIAFKTLSSQQTMASLMAFQEGKPEWAVITISGFVKTATGAIVPNPNVEWGTSNTVTPLNFNIHVQGDANGYFTGSRHITREEWELSPDSYLNLIITDESGTGNGNLWDVAKPSWDEIKHGIAYGELRLRGSGDDGSGDDGSGDDGSGDDDSDGTTIVIRGRLLSSRGTVASHIYGTWGTGNSVDTDNFVLSIRGDSNGFFEVSQLITKAAWEENTDKYMSLSLGGDGSILLRIAKPSWDEIKYGFDYGTIYSEGMLLPPPKDRDLAENEMIIQVVGNIVTSKGAPGVNIGCLWGLGKVSPAHFGIENYSDINGAFNLSGLITKEEWLRNTDSRMYLLVAPGGGNTQRSKPAWDELKASNGILNYGTIT
ncbi:hypothetical protein LJC45_05665, partial [Alistipes sp. OttesenSCG-928-B03]|nr:hypothetical protein [Alistipes sp. OttesenSCG-928-B03]